MPTYLDPASVGYAADLHGYYRQLRDAAPVHEHPNGAWIVLRFDDVRQVLADEKLSKQEAYALGSQRSQKFRAAGGTDEQLTRKGISGTDKPEHTELRRMLQWPLTPRAVAGIEDDAQRMVDELFAAQSGHDVVNLNVDVTYPLIFRILSQILGIPSIDRSPEFAHMRELMWASLNLNDMFVDVDTMRERIQAGKEFADYLSDVVRRKQDHPGHDLTTSLLAARAEGRFDDGQVLGQVITLVHAGMHTTVSQAALSIFALMRNRDQWDLLVERPELLNSAIEELLRFDGTSQYQIRTTPTDYQLGEHTIPAGRHVLPFLASANRDSERWGPKAGQLDIQRTDARQHLGFGQGIHLCLGAWLARMELRVIIGKLIREWPGTRLAGEPEWQSTAFIRSIRELPLRLGQHAESGARAPVAAAS